MTSGMLRSMRKTRVNLAAMVLVIPSVAARGDGAAGSEPVGPPVPEGYFGPVRVVEGPGAEPARDAVVTLTTGDTIRGVLESPEGADPVVLKHPVLGTLSIPRSSVAKVEVSPPAGAAPAPAPAAAPKDEPKTDLTVVVPGPQEPAPAKVVAAPPAPPLSPPPPGIFDNWKFSVETGLTGATGDQEKLNTRLVLNVRREVPDSVTNAVVGWWYGRTDGRETEGRVQADVRNDWPVQKDSAWKVYVAGVAEYNRFQPWDYRVGFNAGFGYDLYKDDSLQVLTRAGLGTTYFETDNRPQRIEFWPGVDARYRIDEASFVTASAEGTIDFQELEDSRATLRAAYEIMLDRTKGTTLKFGVEDRYIRSPAAGREEHNLEYFAALVFRF